LKVSIFIITLFSNNEDTNFQLMKMY